MSADQLEIKLHNEAREFTTLSNLPLSEITNEKYDRVIFLLHGFPDLNTTFNKAWPYLLDHYKSRNEVVLLLAPKLRGYERSSIGPEHEYMLPYLASDVKAWILEINPNLNKPVHLLGHDWGAIIAFKVANLYPELITSMVNLAIPYLANIHIWELLWYAPEQFYLSTYFLTMQYGLVYKSKLTDSNDYLTKLWKYWSPGYDVSKQEISEIRDAFAKDGVVDAVTAYYRHLLRPISLFKSRWPVDFDKVPALIMIGKDDGCMSNRIAEYEEKKLKSKYPKAQVKVLPNSGHFLHREQPETVAKIVTDFFDSFA
ncbi:hypothetical protein KGF56_004322 [Candida oxycetoniae]|uniref:AB hydrolase-1 domain-containing protein n=1 Tax=Candida oxycetoniae TaxID=497107 RepID=A0AAI9SU12_9ASCO|nr:uncharacterized protein KGF56_004322 [Candida oxycetoniae]KAI3402861.2 hypothetical protein KGF56_004322 [Candida oxycetoniae]